MTLWREAGVDNGGGTEARWRAWRLFAVVVLIVGMMAAQDQCNAPIDRSA